MKIVYFHTNTIRSSWAIWNGAQAIRKLGHVVHDAPIPTNGHGAVIHEPTEAQWEHYSRALPSLAVLADADCIIVMGPEYIGGWLVALYGEDWTNKTRAKKIAFILESTDREDIKMVKSDFGEYDVRYWTDVFDADLALDDRTCRPMVDIEKFRQGTMTATVDAGFLGTMYPKRMKFVEALEPHLQNEFTVGAPMAFDLIGERQGLWTDLYVQSINMLKIHVDLPSNNPAPVSRPFETMACGTFLLCPVELPAPLKDGVDYVRYDPNDPKGLAELMRYYLDHDDERVRIAFAGSAMTRHHFNAEAGWREVLG